jgi:ubiquinone/menaquinone biosynthesis C-methylase UbiE
MIKPVPSTSYERMAARYEQERGGQGRAAAIADAILPWLTPGSTIVDVGAGTGIVSAALVHQGQRVIAVDISMGMMSRALDRLPGAAALGDAQFLPCGTRTMSAATFVWSLHHVGNAVAALREARRTVRKGGRVIVVSATPENAPDDVQRLFRRLDVLTAPREADWIERAALSAQLRPVGTSGVEIDVERSPLDLAQQIEDRLYSPLWDLDSERWNSVVVPIMDALRSLKHPHQKRLCTLRSPLFIFEA